MNIISFIILLTLTISPVRDHKNPSFLYGEWEKVAGSATTLKSMIFYPNGILQLISDSKSFQTTYSLDAQTPISYSGYITIEYFGKELAKTPVIITQREPKLIELKCKDQNLVLKKSRTIKPGFQFLK